MRNRRETTACSLGSSAESWRGPTALSPAQARAFENETAGTVETEPAERASAGLQRGVPPSVLQPSTTSSLAWVPATDFTLSHAFWQREIFVGVWALS